MLQRIEDYIRQQHMLKEGDTVIAGVSGGADSVCLLFVLKELSVRYDLSVRVVHVEHGVRGQESLEDAAFVEKLCKKMDIPFDCVHYDVPDYARVHGMSVEEAGRKLRYETFEREADRFPGAKIAVAHNQNDQAETVLFQMIRGSCVRGLGGISPVRGRVIRPLLCVSRREIETYLAELGQPFCVDVTNDSDLYSRNCLRHQVLPVLEQLNVRAVEHIAAGAEQMRELDLFLEGQAEKMQEQWVKRDRSGIRIDDDCARRTEGFLLREMLYRLLVEAAGSAKDISRVHVEQVEKLFFSEVGKSFNLPYGLRAVREPGEVLVGKAVSMTPVKIPAEDLFSARDFSVEALGKNTMPTEIPKKKYTKWIDYDRIENSLCVRTRREGDYFWLNGNGDRQKLKQFFINEKIPRNLRDEILLVADGSHIVWVVGYRLSAYYYTTDQTNRILKIQYHGGKEDE
ncbi:MAG: tRNA lysidine(34) synthetase TilS [Roseburia sp.]